MNGITFVKPVRNRQRIGQRQSLLTKQVIKSPAKTVSKIVILLYMAVLMNSQILIPGQIAKVKDIRRRHQVIFTPEGSKGYISIGQSGLVMQNDVDLMQPGAHCTRRICSRLMNESCNALCLLCSF